MPAPGGTRSDAQVVELATSDVMVHEILPEGRFAMETELRATMGNNAVSICKVEAELNYDGTLMGQVKGVYYLYGSEGGNRVEIYRGARGADGSEHLAVVGAGERYVVKESSFFFKLGPGQHELVFSMSAQASSPLDAEPGFGDPGGQASLQAVARLRVE